MAKRREKGDGSIYQRASDKKWVAYAKIEGGGKSICMVQIITWR
jgi:hypothetical protein